MTAYSLLILSTQNYPPPGHKAGRMARSVSCRSVWPIGMAGFVDVAVLN